MSDDRPTLEALGRRFRTDKSSILHGYLAVYEEVFAKLRDASLSILEIGVLEGASLATWEAYFPNARIVGADINPKVRSLARDRVAIEIIDQADIQDLVDLATKHGPFDIVIEDGSHTWHDQLASFRTLFPFVKDHGFYVVEDLQTNYGTMAEKYRGTARTSCMEYLKKLADHCAAGIMLDPAETDDTFLRSYARRIQRMVFARHVCILQKGPAPDSPKRRALLKAAVRGNAGLLGPPGERLPVTLAARLPLIGEVRSATASLLCGDPAIGFEEFRLSLPAPQADAVGLLYRARLATGDWTGWVAPDAVAGPDLGGEALTGFAVRLDGPEAGQFRVTVAGAFGPEGTLVLAEDGADCVPPGPPQPLRGIEVRVVPRGAGALSPA